MAEDNSLERGVGLYRFDHGNAVLFYDKNQLRFDIAFRNKEVSVDDLKSVQNCINKLVYCLDNEKV